MSRHIILYFGSLMFRSLAVSTLAFLLTLCLRSVAKRHAVWVAVLLIMLLMPALDAVLPPSFVPGAVRQIAIRPIAQIDWFQNDPVLEFSPVTPTAPYETVTKRWLDLWSIALVLYVLVTVASLFRLAWGHLGLAKLKATSGRITTPVLHELAVRNLPALYESEAVLVPLAGGVKQPYVLLPTNWKTWDEWKLRAVLTHELTHIRRGDCLVAVLAATTSCVFWFNPLVWWVQRELSTLAEKACDEASVLLTGDPALYAEVLLQFAFVTQGNRRLRIGGVAMAGQRMQSRIKRVLAMQTPGNGMLTRTAWVVLLVFAMPVLYVSAAIHTAPPARVQEFVSPLTAWVERVATIITPEERVAYQGLQSDPERQHFIEQFWSRRFPSWPDEVAYIIRDEERIAYQSLRTDEESQHFIAQFWLRMDPSPGTPENEFKDDYYRRLEYARRAFEQPSEWWKTDRGRIYIMYGQPNTMDSYPEGGIHISREGETVPYPFSHWRYSRIAGLGDNVVFDFADPTRTGEFHLTSPETRPIGAITPQTDAVEDVRIRDNRGVSTETIKASIQTRTGNQLNKAVVNSDIQRLYQLGFFDDISVEVTGGANGGKVVTFDLREKVPAVGAASAAQTRGGTYERGDSIRVRDIAKPAIFKIVGIPSDRVRADETGVYVNDAAVTGFTHDFLTRFKSEPKVVPAGHYFVMGEQRLNEDVTENMSLVPESSLERIPSN